MVELPSWVRWSGPPRRYDLRRRADRALVYEQVLTEGTDDDVRFFIVFSDLVELWDDLVLPASASVRGDGDGVGLDVSEHAAAVPSGEGPYEP